MADQVRILLVDDHEIVREGLRVLFGRQAHLEVVAEAHDGRSAIEQAPTVAPDVAVVDLHLPDMEGLQVIAALTEQIPDLRTIVLSADADLHLVQGALRLGVQGYVLKGNSTTDILNAIEAVQRGQVYFSPEIASKVAAGYRQAISGPSSPGLSPREVEVLRLLADGKSSKDIAGVLGVGVTTVDTHRHHIMRRLGLFSVAELTKYAIREGLTQL